MQGLIHLYHGEGKGKTTCAMGLALRAAGRGLPVLIAQFLKGEDSGERHALRSLPGVTLLPLPAQVKFSFLMSAEEKRQEAALSAARLEQAFALANARGGLLLLDELCAALSAGLLETAAVTALLDARNPTLEVVITGRNPPQALLERADYCTEFVKQRHPYDRGILARRGIEL